jgi:hypothetical protein
MNVKGLLQKLCNQTAGLDRLFSRHVQTFRLVLCVNNGGILNAVAHGHGSHAPQTAGSEVAAQ